MRVKSEIWENLYKIQWDQKAEKSIRFQTWDICLYI